MDKHVIGKIQAGDREAFKELYDEYFDYALRVAKAITKNDSHAADAVQETFIRVYKSIKNYDLHKPFKPWFYRILINECYRITEKRAKLIPTDHAWENDEQLAINDQPTFEKYEDLYTELAKLKDIYRIPIILKYLQDLSEKEIAETLEVNLNTIKSRLFKGRNRLKEALQKIQTKEG